MPENQRRFSYVFRTWEEGREAAREVMQGQFGFPSVFRLSDPEERPTWLSNSTVSKGLPSTGSYLPGDTDPWSAV